MKNLKLWAEISVKLKLQFEEEVVLFSAVDIERNRFFVSTSFNLVYTAPLPTPQNGEARRGIILPTEVNPVDLEAGDCITSFDYLMEKESLVIGTSRGLLLLYMVDSNATEVVGRVEGGVKCIEPSPDGDLLAVTTGPGQLLVLTDDWDVLYEIALEERVEGFDVREPLGSTTGALGAPICWRGDGKYLATLSRLQNTPLLQIKVWERDSGLLHSYSEPKDLVPTVLEWMPSGGVIATVRYRTEERKNPSVLFFERNGLERSSFDIDEDFDVVVDSLKWSSDSNLLAGIVRCKEYDCLKIWFFCNNHWYLKQEIRYLKQDAVRFMWDPTKPLQLLCWTLRGLITIYNFAWASAVKENSVALVVDHSKILVTPLSISLLPPPMFSFSLKYSSPVREMAFYSKGTKNLVAAFLSAGHLCIAELPALELWEDLEGKEFTVEACCFETSIHSVLHLLWLDSHVLLGASPVLINDREHQNNELGYHIVEIKASCSEDQALKSTTCSGWLAKLTSQTLVEQLVTSIASDPSRKCSAFVELNNGGIFEYISNMGSQGLTSSPRLKKLHDMLLLPPCPWMTVALVNKDGLLKPLLLGLDEIGRLSVDGKTLCNNCTSFSFYSNSSSQMISHLILTTKQDLLFVVEISDILDGNAETKYENFVYAPAKRRGHETKSSISVWERGAKIVGVLDGDEAGVILQTNRGNLECVYPRKLVLTSIINALVQKRFRDALLMVRRHRIDFNIIVDYCGWQAFVQSASEFVRQVNDLSHITEFVCAIKNDIVTEKLYKDYISLPSSKVQIDELSLDHGDSNSCNKVSSVLLAIRKSLEEHVSEHPARELCILTTLARSDPPALEEALKRIKVSREMEISGNDNPRLVSYPSAEEALRHLLWLADPNAVYEAALGLYDLNLAAIVALNAQKDPKEFLPFLQELESMPTHMMQYKVDFRLQRYEMALKCIASAGDIYHEECMVLLRNQPQLFPLALELFTDPSKRAQIYEAWGDHLHDKKCYEEAAMTFLCCSNYEKALKAYHAGGHWRGVLTVAGLLKLGKEDILRLASELCEELQELGRPGEAAIISLEYSGDVRNATNLLVAAREFEEALRTAYMSRDDKLVLEVKNASLEFAGTLITEYEEGLEKVGKYVARYLAVRQRRLLLAAKIRSEEQSTSIIDDDTVSEASSNFSGMSAYSTGTTSVAQSVGSSTSSKARGSRRQRNRGKIRAGSPGEELALIDHLKGMALTSEAKRQLKTILAALLMICMVETATKVQHMAGKFQLSQMAAVKLSEDTVSSDVVDEQSYSLDRYIWKMRSEVDYAVDFTWRSKILPY